MSGRHLYIFLDEGGNLDFTIRHSLFYAYQCLQLGCLEKMGRWQRLFFQED